MQAQINYLCSFMNPMNTFTRYLIQLPGKLFDRMLDEVEENLIKTDENNILNKEAVTNDGTFTYIDPQGFTYTIVRQPVGSAINISCY